MKLARHAMGLPVITVLPATLPMLLFQIETSALKHVNYII